MQAINRGLNSILYLSKKEKKFSMLLFMHCTKTPFTLLQYLSEYIFFFFFFNSMCEEEYAFFVCIFQLLLYSSRMVQCFACQWFRTFFFFRYMYITIRILHSNFSQFSFVSSSFPFKLVFFFTFCNLQIAEFDALPENISPWIQSTISNDLYPYYALNGTFAHESWTRVCVIYIL